jgi:hypothetical protein
MKDACCFGEKGRREGESKREVKGGVKGNPPKKENRGKEEERIMDQGRERAVEFCCTEMTLFALLLC